MQVIRISRVLDNRLGVIQVAMRIGLFLRVSKGQNPFKRHLLDFRLWVRTNYY